MNRYVRSIPFNMIHVCIDDYNGYQIGGRAYNNTIESPILFSDIQDLILKMDDIFNRNGNPQSSQVKRTFQGKTPTYGYQNKPKVLNDFEQFLKIHGKILDIDVVVKSRGKSTWQGSVLYQNEEIQFQTLLDFIKIIEGKLIEKNE